MTSIYIHTKIIWKSIRELLHSIPIKKQYTNIMKIVLLHKCYLMLHEAKRLMPVPFFWSCNAEDIGNTR